MTGILTHIEAGVMTLTLNRTEKKNSITSSMYAALADSLASAKDDAAVRVVVIQGHATIFSAGNDLADFLHRPPVAEGEQAPVFRFLHGIAAFPKPVVAAVCGPAVGIGTTMLFHCDLVYAGDNAAFSMPFVNLGIVPEAASSLIVPQMFGYHRAAEAFLLGEPFMAEAALEVGLVNKVLPPTECNDYAQTVAKKLAAKPLSSVVETKRLLKVVA
jgi:enoyl-CoA hydratase/carnithine racemase